MQAGSKRVQEWSRIYRRNILLLLLNKSGAPRCSGLLEGVEAGFRSRLPQFRHVKLLKSALKVAHILIVAR